MDGDIKNVFISHVHEDDDGLAKLKDLVERRGLKIRFGGEARPSAFWHRPIG